MIARQADLVARWLLVGFIHGVMNTDNMSIAGETIDYGPCAFMDAYDAATVFSSIDSQGRYAYGNQPRIAHWNLVRLAETLLPILSDDIDKASAEAKEALEGFAPRFSNALLTGMRKKIGLFTEHDDDAALIQALLNVMATQSTDFTFRRLSDAAGPDGNDAVRGLFPDPASFDAWAARWRQRIAQEPQDGATRHAVMRAVNPAYIPRNHRVEEVIQAGVERDDFAPFEELLAVLSTPFEEQPIFERYADPPQPHEKVHKTFCGT